MKRENFSPQTRTPRSMENPTLEEPARGVGYHGARQELVEVHQLSMDVVEHSLNEAAKMPGVPIDVATHNGFLYQVTADKKIPDSYTVRTRAL